MKENSLGSGKVKTQPSALFLKYEAMAEKNENVFKSSAFGISCANAKIKATKRQASKFRRKFGLAYKNR